MINYRNRRNVPGALKKIATDEKNKNSRLS